MKYTNNSILLAPANMHTILYDDILASQGDCTNIEVYALNTFISRFFKGKKQETLEILYQYKELLKDLSKENAFYESKDSFDFLKACYDFLQVLKTYHQDLNQLPKNSPKQKHLKEVLTLLFPFVLKEEQTHTILQQKYDFNNVYIVRKEYSDMDSFWIEFLLKNGAHHLENTITTKKHYWTCSNSKKQAEIVAKTIIQQEFDAQDVFVASNDDTDHQLLAHFFDFYKIPYTFLQNDNVSNLQYQFISILNWCYKKNISTLTEVLKSCFPYEENVLKYIQTFNEDTPLDLDYEENSLIDEYTYTSYQKIKEEYLNWKEENKELFDLDYTNISASLDLLSKYHSNLSKEDFKIASSIYDVVRQALPYIHKKDDILLLIEAIDRMQVISGPMEYKGVLIGKRKDITPLRKTTFLLSAHNKQFPSLQLKSGLFDEVYMQDTNLPSLQDRLRIQREQIFKSLGQAEDLYVLYPQSNFEGKSFMSSLEMDNWMEIKPTFQQIDDYSIYEKPEFELSEEQSKALFFNDNDFVGSVSRLESFTSCSLQHFIRYGLHLKEVKEWEDIRIRGTILHHILEVLSTTYGKSYVNVSKDKIEELVEQEFSFAKILFPNRLTWLESQKLEYVSKIGLVLEQLAYFEENWHMHTSEREYKYNLEWSTNDCMISLYGYIDRVDVNGSSSFCVFDYKSSDKELKLEDFYAGKSLQLATYTIAYEEHSKLVPAGQFYISLKTTPIDQKAYKANYRKKNAELAEIEINPLEFKKSKKLKGWKLQDISTYCDEPSIFSVKKDTPSFEEMKKEWKVIIEDIISEMKEGNIQPNYVKGACDYCAYKTICRNARNEIELINRLEKEDQQ